MNTQGQQQRCPNPRHSRSRVAKWGKFERSTGTFQGYRCRPLTAKPHRFAIPIDESSRRRHSAGGGPPCPEHPKAHTIRFGTYRARNPRQLYECRHHGKCSHACQRACDGTVHAGPCRFICLKSCRRDHEGDCFRPCRARREKCEAEHDGTCVRLCPSRCDGSHDGACVRACRKACDGTHTFTPPLPRFHVGSGDQCVECLELRGYHRGETAAARKHRPTARNIAQALNDESLGESYATVGRAVLLRAGVVFDGKPRRRPRDVADTGPPDPAEMPLPVEPQDAPLEFDLETPEEPDDLAEAMDWGEPAEQPKKKISEASRQRHRFWHVGADIAEAFAPVLWGRTERELRERAEKNRLLGPAVWVIDDIPVYAIDETGKRRKTDGYSVFCLSELDWSDPETPGKGRLRLVRALPKSTSVAWRLVFDEVGYRPDIIVSDAATSIRLAVSDHWRGDEPLLVPSLWHLRRALETNALSDALKVKNDAGKALAAHLSGLARDGAAMASVEGWHDWWEKLDRLAAATGKVKPRSLAAAHDNYERRMAAALPALLAEPRIVKSTGGLESQMRSLVGGVLRPPRKQHFGNIERTNNLMDLVVVRANDGFVDLIAVAKLIEADERPHNGHTVPMRSVQDPSPRGQKPYRSLRDEFQMNAVAAERNLL